MKIGIALGGGGARGFAHVGILKRLNAAGIDCEIVTGTSMGALVGAVYAANNLDKFEEEVCKIKITDVPLLLSPTWSTSGFFSGRNALEHLMNLIGYDYIEQLPKPYASVSVDLDSSTIVPATSGNIRQAIRASSAIPAVFTPVALTDSLLVDGATMDPVPVEINKKLGADFVIAVDLFGESYYSPKVKEQNSLRAIWPEGIRNALSYVHSLGERWFGGFYVKEEEKHSKRSAHLIQIIERTLAITQRSITAARLAQHPPNFIIRPPVSHVGLLDFHRAEPIIAIGEKTMDEYIDRLLEAIEKA